MLPIDGDSTSPVIDIRDVITSCDNIDVCPREAVYMRIDLGGIEATFFAYERPDEGYFDAVSSGGGFQFKPSLSSHGLTRPVLYFFRDSYFPSQRVHVTQVVPAAVRRILNPFYVLPSDLLYSATSCARSRIADPDPAPRRALTADWLDLTEAITLWPSFSESFCLLNKGAKTMRLLDVLAN